MTVADDASDQGERLINEGKHADGTARLAYLTGPRVQDMEEELTLPLRHDFRVSSIGLVILSSPDTV